jgi:putative transposase
MARLARVVAAGVPHHVTQRGNRRQKVFFGAADYELYKTLLAEGCREARVAVWAYCLMPNHVHLILVPSTAAGLRAMPSAPRNGRAGRWVKRDLCAGWKSGWIGGSLAASRVPNPRAARNRRSCFEGELSIVSPEHKSFRMKHATAWQSYL